MEVQLSSTLRRCENGFRLTGPWLIISRHSKYPEYPVVVSEIASICRDKESVFRFTAQVANWMDECPWVFEYAFFGCMAKVADDFVSPEAQLMNPDGSFKLLMNKLMNEQPMTGL